MIFFLFLVFMHIQTSFYNAWSPLEVHRLFIVFNHVVNTASILSLKHSGATCRNTLRPRVWLGISALQPSLAEEYLLSSCMGSGQRSGERSTLLLKVARSRGFLGRVRLSRHIYMIFLPSTPLSSSNQHLRILSIYLENCAKVSHSRLDLNLQNVVLVSDCPISSLIFGTSLFNNCFYF